MRDAVAAAQRSRGDSHGQHRLRPQEHPSGFILVPGDDARRSRSGRLGHGSLPFAEDAVLQAGGGGGEFLRRILVDFPRSFGKVWERDFFGFVGTHGELA